MSYKITGSWYVQKQLQYIEEATYGITPPNPTFLHAGPITDMTETVETPNIKYRQIGSRDIQSGIPTGQSNSMEVTFNPVDTNLIGYGLKLPAGAGTVERSLTFLKSQLINGTEMFTIYRGARVESISITIANDAAVEVTMSFVCKDISTPSTTHGLTSPGFFTGGATGDPWTNITPGVANGPLKINNIAVDTATFSCEVAHNLAIVKPNGEIVNKFVEPTFRDISFEFDTWYKDTTNLADLKSFTPRAMLYHLSTDKRLNFGGAYLESAETGDSTGSSDPKMLSFTGFAKTVDVESY